MKASERIRVYDKYSGKCAYCGCDIEYKKMHVDHKEPIRRRQKWDKVNSKWIPDGCDNPEADCFENYMPACASCNIQKHSMDLEGFRESIQQFINSLNSYHNQYKFAKRYGLIEETGNQVQFYFEKYILYEKENTQTHSTENDQ